MLPSACSRRTQRPPAGGGGGSARAQPVEPLLERVALSTGTGEVGVMTRLWTSAGMELGPVVLVACDVPAGRQLGFQPRAASARSPQPQPRRQASAVEDAPGRPSAPGSRAGSSGATQPGPGGGATQRLGN